MIATNTLRLAVWGRAFIGPSQWQGPECLSFPAASGINRGLGPRTPPPSSSTLRQSPILLVDSPLPPPPPPALLDAIISLSPGVSSLRSDALVSSGPSAYIISDPLVTSAVVVDSERLLLLLRTIIIGVGTRPRIPSPIYTILSSSRYYYVRTNR